MNVLFITSRLPYPPLGGDRLKGYWLLNILSKHFKVDLVSITEGEVPDSFYKWANQHGIKAKIFRKKDILFYRNASRFLINRLPIQVNYYYFKDVHEYVCSVYKKYDILFATLIRTAPYIINKDRIKILELTDSIGIHYQRAKKKSRSLKWRIIYALEAKRLLNYERFCISKFDKVLFVNKEEMEYFGQQAKTAWMPNGVDEKLLVYDRINEKYKHSIVFFGKMDYQPNINAVTWFANNVMPHVSKNLNFVIIGINPAPSIKRLGIKSKNINILGYLDDPYEIIKSSLCVVAPMQIGAGIQNKVLESMALGTINIVSSLAAKPLGVNDKKEVLIIDDPVSMANVINDIYLNLSRYEYLKINSREFIKNSFTWSIYEKNLINLIDEVVKCSPKTGQGNKVGNGLP